MRKPVDYGTCPCGKRCTLGADACGDCRLKAKRKAARAAGRKPVETCRHCGSEKQQGLCSSKRCRQAHNTRPGLLEDLLAAYCHSERYPVEVTDPARRIVAPWAADADLQPRATRRGLHARQLDRGLVATTCPVCASPAWQEPPMLRLVGGTETTEHPIRCPQCNPIRQVGGGRCA